MTEANKIQLDGEQLEYARRAHQAVMENLLALREIIFTELGMEIAPASSVGITLRIPVNPDDCITIEDEHGCGMYCDPPGICQPCS